ncbi:hypothetical protein [Roseimaritima sediminicola]|uniref:hypothetical protein n=1 Tax=Roseimaritima sediminicola TaxID=2662066 RepID=UPI001298389B|nr:hypothetical protein [Roseimaritima sediminicola]
MVDVPEIRIRTLRDCAPAADGQFVLYWMIAYRRGRHNYALQRAVQWARKLKRPLVILEGLQCDYRWACDRFSARSAT